jgi:hypothetical protein
VDHGAPRTGDATQKPDPYNHRMHNRSSSHAKAFALPAMPSGLGPGPLALSSVPVDILQVVEETGVGQPVQRF